MVGMLIFVFVSYGKICIQILSLEGFARNDYWLPLVKRKELGDPKHGFLFFLLGPSAQICAP